MPGAWESSKKVLVATLTRELVTTAWAKSHRDMRLPPGHSIVYFTGLPFDHARNSAVQMMLDGGFEYLFFVDDDVMIPPDAYAILKSNNLDVVSGLYYRRSDPIVPVAIVKTPGGYGWLASWKYGDIIPVDMVGAGCLLVKRKIFEIMPSPWFEWTVDRHELPQQFRASEDFVFCKKLVEIYQIKPHVDTRVQCIHCGLSSMTVDSKINPLVPV